MLCDWFPPQTRAERIKWSVSHDAVQMEKGEKSMKHFGRNDKIVGALASLDVMNSVEYVNRKFVMTLTNEYEVDEKSMSYREGDCRI